MNKEVPMADDKSKTGTADDVRINVNEAYEVQYWSKKFDVTPEELHDAVAAVGPMAADVQRELAR
jgi:hypothetical protein